MKSTIQLFLLVLLGLMFSVSGFAGEKEGLGLLFKTGPVKSVGVSYELSDFTTLRATFGFDSYTAETEIHHLYVTKYDTDSTGYDVSLGLLFSLIKKNNLTLYAGFEAGLHSKNREERVSPYETAGGVTPYYEEYTETKEINGYSGNLILGVRHKLGKRIAIFGEFGFGFQRRHRDDRNLAEGSLSSAKTTQWDLKRSGIGVVFYL